MIINEANLAALFTAFNTAFTSGLSKAPSAYLNISMVIPSNTAEESYGWLGQFPGVREWLGPRHVCSLAAHGYAIKNRDFESTISIPRNSIEDDRLGVFAPAMTELGRAAGEHPDQLIFGLLMNGFATDCYDGQFFFDTDHPVGDGEAPPASVSNVQAGSETPWFLLDTSHAMKPLIYQERVKYELTALDRSEDRNVFFNNEFIYGTRGRSNAGFGFWQLAFASKAELTPENYEAARAAMVSLKGDEGRPLGIRPDTLVVPPLLEGPAMRILNNGTRVVMIEDTPVAIQNEWAGSAKLIVTPWVA